MNGKGQINKSCFELARTWHTNKYLRKLKAAILVVDDSLSTDVINDVKTTTGGQGNVVLEKYHGIIGVGPGPYAIGKG